MSTYRAIAANSNKALSLLAVTDKIRIARIEAKNVNLQGSAGSLGVTFQLWTGAAHSGGTSIAIQPMRPSGAAPALATARADATTTGTVSVLDLVAQQDTSGGTASAPPISPTYAPAFDLILEPGMAVRVATTPASVVSSSLLIYFEVLQLDWTDT